MSRKYWNNKAEEYNQFGISWHWLKVGYIPVFTLLKDYVGNLKGKNLLDFGCGNGRIGRILKEYYGVRVTGVDISEDMIKQAEELDPEGLYGVISADCKTTFEDNSFDCVMANWVLVTISSLEIMEKELLEIYRVLKPGGIFTALVNNDQFVGKRTVTWQSGIAEKEYKSGDEIKVKFYFKDKEPVTVKDYFWTSDDYYKVFKRADFARINTFVPEYNSEKNNLEVQYLQRVGLFPKINHSLPEDEKGTILVSGIKY